VDSRCAGAVPGDVVPVGLLDRDLLREAQVLLAQDDDRLTVDRFAPIVTGGAYADGFLVSAGSGLAINAGWRIACPFSTPWHALGAHGAAIIATVILGALIGRFLENRRLHIGGRRS